VAGLALLTAVVELGGTSIAARHQVAVRPLTGLGMSLLAGGPIAMLFRHRARVAMYVVVLASTIAFYLLGYPYGPIVVGAALCLFGAVRTGHRRGAWLVTGVGYLIFVALGIWRPAVGGIPLRAVTVREALAALGWLCIALLLAEAIRIRSERFLELARIQAERARARAEQERRQASEERLRIARELHDVLGHHLSLINVQAGVGLHLMDERPEQARAALAAIKQASAEALREVRSVLGVLRAQDEEAPRAPAPSLANLGALVADAGAREVVEGRARELPPEVDRAAYRIAQEGLTNVRRHAGPSATATVTIVYGETLLTVRVEDTGRGAPAGEIESGDGNGIAGMRARATALGGDLTAGPDPSGGFIVEARIPTGESP
jgi:signal transduction histidine kinase